jgi:peptidoglycan/LPS O-acetylase OafA/YrhL
MSNTVFVPNKVINDLTYRADIDGLRALAVLFVVIHHAFPKFLPSGFVGVDIFFVISGYLICSIIIRRCKAGTFSILDFYSRRIRRIMPSFVIVVTVCMVVGWLVMLPLEYEQFARHAIFSIFFLENYKLFTEINYFDDAAAWKPLLHMWSLSVEEQFYLVIPWIFLFFHYRNRLLISIVVILAVASFIWAVMSAYRNEQGMYYWPHIRFWELLVGTGVALYHEHRPHRVDGINFISVISVILFIATVVFVSPSDNFPNYTALLPVMAAALFILAGPRARLNKLLTVKPIVYIGLISYPLYLWHWPILSFATILYGGRLSVSVSVLLVSFSVALSVATYELVEKKTHYVMRTNHVVMGSIVALVFLALVAYTIQKNAGIPSRDTPWITPNYKGEVGTPKYFDHLNATYLTCQPESVAIQAPVRLGILRCAQSKAGINIDIALIGDSFAEHLFSGFAAELKNQNVAYYIHGRGPPFISNSGVEFIVKHILQSQTIQTVVISSNWLHRSKRIKEPSNLFLELESIIKPLLANRRKVYLIYGMPIFDFNPRSCLYERLYPVSNIRCSQTSGQLLDKNMTYEKYILMAKEKYPEVRLISLWDYLCSTKSCSMLNDDMLLFRDSSHFNVSGSSYIASRIISDNPEIVN